MVQPALNKSVTNIECGPIAEPFIQLSIPMVFGDIAGKLHTVSPRVSDLPPLAAQLIVRSIAINSAYTSRVMVVRA